MDDDPVTRRVVTEVLRSEGWQVAEAIRSADISPSLYADRWALVFCGLQTADGHISFDLLREVRGTLGARVPIIAMASCGDPHAALEAVLNGAFDFLRKPCREAEVRERARIVRERFHAAEVAANDAQPETMTDTQMIPGDEYALVGRSDAMIKVFTDIAKALKMERAAGSNHGDMNQRPPSFFITGETGTGKELVARTIHRHSRYRGGAFVAVNCGAFPADLAESELFGHRAGAFTGAAKDREGLWESAAGGTIFLDEITEAPHALQPKLLRVLQDGAVRRIGGNRPLPVDAQVIVASNRDMATEIAAGRFRQDLYYRLSLHKLHLPSLKERPEDIPLLVEHFAGKYAARRVRFARDALDLLAKQKWAGNVRELENVVRAAVVRSSDDVVYAVDLLSCIDSPLEITRPCVECGGLIRTTEEVAASPATTLEESVAAHRHRVVREALARHGGNITRTAQALKISRPTLHKLLAELKHAS